MKQFKDNLLPQDEEIVNILSLNILLSEMMPAAFSQDSVDPKEYIVFSSKLQTRFLNIRRNQKPITKMINKQFISPNEQ